MSRFSETSSGASSPAELNALQTIIGVLHPLDEEARQRIFESAATFLRIETNGRGLSTQTNVPHAASQSVNTSTAASAHARFSDDTSLSPKQFLLEKQPRTDVERIACLAYYLTHYRATPHFKTLELSVLNTEAAQPKFTNAAYASNNAVKLGYIVPSTKGQRQLSAIGERFVLALPDRDAAKAALDSGRRRPKLKRARRTKVADEE